MKAFFHSAALLLLTCLALQGQISNTICRVITWPGSNGAWNDIWFLQDGRAFHVGRGGLSFFALPDPAEPFYEIVGKRGAYTFRDYGIDQYGKHEIGLTTDLLPGTETGETERFHMVPDSLRNITYGISILKPTNPAGNQNFSCRTSLVGGGKSTLGFVVSRTRGWYLIRAAGESLSQFGLTKVVANPDFKLFDSKQRIVARGTQWNETADRAEMFKAFFQLVGAFDLSANSKERVFVCELGEGAYTVEFSNPTEVSGECLLEVYALPFAKTWQ